MRPFFTLKSAATTGAMVFLLTGCETLQKHGKQYLPGVTGIVMGAICYSTTGEKYRAIATGVCAVTGAFLGSLLKEHLDEMEQQQLQEATAKTMESGQKQTIVSDKGTTITTEKVASTTTGVTPSSDNCGSVKQTIVTKDNQRYEETVSACKKDDVWVAA